jgi:hypothetical protein
MSRQTWIETLVTAETSGSAVTNTTTPTSVLPTPAVFTIPANYFDVGRQLEIEAWGQVSTASSSPGTLTMSLYFAGATFCASPAFSLNTSASNDTWSCKWLVTCRAIGNGTNANAMFTGTMSSAALATTPSLIPATGPTVSSGFNSTVSNALDLYATWSTASSSNSIQLVQYYVRSVN